MIQVGLNQCSPSANLDPELTGIDANRVDDHIPKGTPPQSNTSLQDQWFYTYSLQSNEK